jgi:hypothetical protein
VSQDNNLSPIKNNDELNQDETTSLNESELAPIFNLDESEQSAIAEDYNNIENSAESIDSSESIDSVDFVDSIDSIDFIDSADSIDSIESIDSPDSIEFIGSPNSTDSIDAVPNFSENFDNYADENLSDINFELENPSNEIDNNITDENLLSDIDDKQISSIFDATIDSQISANLDETNSTLDDAQITSIFANLSELPDLAETSDEILLDDNNKIENEIPSTIFVTKIESEQEQLSNDYSDAANSENSTDNNTIDIVDSTDESISKSGDFIDSIETNNAEMSAEFIEPLQEQNDLNDLDKIDFSFEEIEKTEFDNNLSTEISTEEQTTTNLSDESEINFTGLTDSTYAIEINDSKIPTELTDSLQETNKKEDEIEELFANDSGSTEMGNENEFESNELSDTDNFANGDGLDFIPPQDINDPFANDNSTGFNIGESDNLDVGEFGISPESVGDIGTGEKITTEKTSNKKTKRKRKEKKLSGGLLSAILGVKPIGAEGVICLIVFSVLLLWIIIMNFQAFFSRPSGVGSGSTIWYVTLLNLFGALALLVPAWMFFNRGTINDVRDMKDRNDVFRAMLGVGLITMSICTILLMTEYFRYDFTIKAGDHKTLTIIDGGSNLPEIKPNGIPQPLP